MNKPVQFVFLPAKEKTALKYLKGRMFISLPTLGCFGARNNHLYILSEDEINHGDYFYSTTFNAIRQSAIDKHEADGCKKVVATTNPELIQFSSGILRKKIKCVPSITQSDIEYIISLYNGEDKKVDIEKLADEAGYTKQGHSMIQDSLHDVWIESYNKCLQDNSDKRFTLDDMQKAFIQGSYSHNKFDSFIQSLAEQKNDTVMVEYEEILCNDVLDEGTNYKEWVESKPKQQEGCVVIVRK